MTPDEFNLTWNLCTYIYIYVSSVSDASSRTPRKSVYIKSSSNDPWAPTSSAEVYLTLIYPALPQPVSAMAKSASPNLLWLTSCPGPTPALARDVMAGFPLGLASRATLPICRGNKCVYMHTSISSAARCLSDLFHLNSKLKAHQTDWGGQF